MQTTNITDNLIQLTRYRFVNAFLVREDDGFTLIGINAFTFNMILGAAILGAMIFNIHVVRLARK